MAKKSVLDVETVTLLEDLAKAEIVDLSLAEIAEHFVRLAGGAKGMAALMFNQLRDPAASPMVKARIMDLILRSVKFANEQNPPVVDLGLLSDADLDRELKELLAKHAAKEEEKA